MVYRLKVNKIIKYLQQGLSYDMKLGNDGIKAKNLLSSATKDFRLSPQSCLISSVVYLCYNSAE